jgi:MFS family permease
VLVVARIIQGIGGAMMVPVGRLVILRTVSKAELIKSLAWLTIPALIGPMLGPPVGGFLTTYASWPWIFWINVPVGILGFVLATLYIPDVRGERRVRFDRIGFGLSSIGLTAFMAGSTTLGLNLLPLSVVLGLIAFGGALIVAYVFYARHRKDPVLNLSLLRIPTFRHSFVGSMLFRIGIGATPFLLPLLLQLGFGMTPFQSGMITFSAAVGALTMKFAAPPILRRFGFRRVLVANTFVAAGFVALPALFTPATPVLLMTGLLLIGGAFRSLHFPGINALVFADIPPEQMSQATTIPSVAQQLSISLGITVGAVSLEAMASLHGGAIAAETFWPAFAIVGVITLGSLVPFWKLEHEAGQEMSGHQPAPDPVTAMRERQ